MPGLNGFQATRAISRDPDTRSIPIILCTSKSQETDKIWGMRQGARDYIVKPVRTRGAAREDRGGRLTAGTGGTMARAARMDLRTFQQELADPALGEDRRAGRELAARALLRGRAVARAPGRRGRGGRAAAGGRRPADQAVVPRARQHPRQPVQRDRLLRLPRARQRARGGAEPARAVRAAHRRAARRHRRGAGCSACATWPSSPPPRRSPDAPAWYAQRWIDSSGSAWQEIDLARLARDPAFLQVGA